MELEMEEMRQQMIKLKKILEKQEIVNDRLLRSSMRQKMSYINRRYLILSILCLAIIPYSYWAFVMLNGLSLGFWISTCVLMLISFCYTLYNGRYLSREDLFEKDLLNARKIVANAKKKDSDWLIAGIPLAILWITYFCYEEYSIHGSENGNLFVAIGIISGIVGLAIGLKIHFRIQLDYQKIIDEIDEIRE